MLTPDKPIAELSDDELHDELIGAAQEMGFEVVDNRDTIEAPTPLTLPWGGPAPEGVTIAWGGRAIYILKSHDTRRAFGGRGMRGRVLVKAHTECTIDVPFDRGSMVGGTERERKALAIWINRKGIPAVKRECIARWITGDSAEVVLVERDGYAIKASPRASYGYLYLTAWRI